MKESYLPFYSRYTVKAPLTFLFDIMRERRKLRRLSLKNRMIDYSALAKDRSLMQLHAKINSILLDAHLNWPHYDYGEGYFYQSYERAHISGFRDTAGRLSAMNLQQLVTGKRVLDIGCNSGFIALSISDAATFVQGMDINEYDVRIGIAVREHFNIDNVELFTSAFEAWDDNEKYDIILSFANHSTYDQQTRHTVQDYFDKCASLLGPGGELLVESHAPEFEGEKFADVIRIIEERFEILEQRVLDYGTFLDRGRTFVRAVRR